MSGSPDSSKLARAETPSNASDAPDRARARLSAVLVVKDEAPRIQEAIEQLRFADEIVVVDTGSTDGTLAICRELADVCLEHDGGPHGLIHVAKNVGIRAASGPWVLNLDADERLTLELRDEILAALCDPDPEIAAYALPFTHYFFGKFLRHGGFRGPIVRLYRAARVRYPEDRAHSTPVIDGRIAVMQNLVVHFNHPTIASFVTKMNRYTSSDAPLMVAHGRGGLRNRPLPRLLALKLVTAPLSVFWNRYIKHGGWRDGVHGLVAATLMAAYQFVEYGKVWERLHARDGGDGGGERAEPALDGGDR